MDTILKIKDGWDFTAKNMGAVYTSSMGVIHVENVDAAIKKLTDDLNELKSNASTETLKGFVAERWHTDTFNLDAVLQDSQHRATTVGSTELGSVDVSTNFDMSYSLKYYKTGADSAKQQSTNVVQRYHKYLSTSHAKNKLTLEEFKRDNGFIDDFQPVYEGQERLIPADQLSGAITYLKRQIIIEQARGGHRLELLKGYSDTLQKLTDRIKDNVGVESIPLTKDESKAIAEVCKSGKFKPEDFGIKLNELITTEYMLQQALKAGCTAATITLVLQLVPEIYKSIDYLIKNGEIEPEQLKEIGLKATSSSAKAFMRGSIASAITLSCKSGRLGAYCKNITPTQIGAITVIAIDAIQYSIDVSNGKMTRKEMGMRLTKEIIISSGAIAGGAMAQTVLPMLPVFGYMLGSFVGSVVASTAISLGERATLSLCVETGFTFFGLVDQDYTLPDEMVKYLGLQSYEAMTYEPEVYEEEIYKPEIYEAEVYEPETLDIVVLRRGIISVGKIGYIVS